MVQPPAPLAAIYLIRTTAQQMVCKIQDTQLQLNTLDMLLLTALCKPLSPQSIRCPALGCMWCSLTNCTSKPCWPFYVATVSPSGSCRCTSFLSSPEPPLPPPSPPLPPLLLLLPLSLPSWLLSASAGSAAGSSGTPALPCLQTRHSSTTPGPALHAKPLCLNTHTLQKGHSVRMCAHSCNQLANTVRQPWQVLKQPCHFAQSEQSFSCHHCPCLCVPVHAYSSRQEVGASGTTCDCSSLTSLSSMKPRSSLIRMRSTIPLTE